MKDFKIVYSDQPFPPDFCVKNSLFLAGPTSRTEKTQWRLDAIEMLKKYNEIFSYVAVPERTSWKDGFKYEEQVLWEKQGLETSSTIIFGCLEICRQCPVLQPMLNLVGGCMKILIKFYTEDQDRRHQQNT